MLSDYRDGSFGLAYGVLIKEVRLLARAIFVVGADDRIRYVQIVPEVTTHPDFDSFPMFSPDGRKLVWASNRNQTMPGETNIFIADWVP